VSRLVSVAEQALQAAPCAVAHALGAYLSVLCRPSKRTGRGRARQRRLPFLAVTFLTVGQAEQETLGTEGLADRGDRSRLHGAARYKLGGKQPAICCACL